MPCMCEHTYVLFAAVVASVGGILFGYDIGITSGALLQLKEDFKLTDFQQEVIVSSVLIGAFLTSFVGGNIVDSFGRKVGIGVSCVLFIAGALLLCFSINLAMLIVGRLVVGMAVSLSVTAECTYISEISPPKRRGMMVSLNEVGITSGFLLAYLINYIFITTPQGWKYMFGASAVPALIQGFGVLFLPQSHHYLLQKGEREKAETVLSRLRNSDKVDEEVEAILLSIDEQKSWRYIDLFSNTSNMRSRMFLGMALVFLQQFSGNANVLYYAPTVFQRFGYNTDSAATLASVGLGAVKVIATTVTLLIVDRLGRRTLLLTGCLLMALSIIVLGVVGTVTDYNHSTSNKPFVVHHSIISRPITEKNSSSESTSSTLESLNPDEIYLNNRIPGGLGEDDKEKPEPNNLRTDGGPSAIVTDGPKFKNETFNESEKDSEDTSDENYHFTTKVTAVVSLMVFVCAYGISYGPVTWLVLSEIFPGSLRGRAVSVATCVNWASNIIVSLSFLDVLNAAGIGPTFVLYGCISLGASIFIYLCVPETKNKTLEEIDESLSYGLLRKDLKICRCFQNANVEHMSSRTISSDQRNSVQAIELNHNVNNFLS